MSNREKDITITFSAQGHNPVTVSGNKFHQLANSYDKPKQPCRKCGNTEFGQTKHYYWICTKCGALSGWRKGDE